MAKIRNKKTGVVKEVYEEDLHIYGLGRKKLPKALLGKKQHGDLESMYNQGNYDNMQLLPERTDFGQIGNFNKIGGSGMDNPQINLGNTQPNFNTGQYPNTQLPTGYQPNYTYPAQDYGELDESLYTNTPTKRPQEQIYNPNVITDTPIVNTPEFNPGLTQSVVDYNKQMGRGKTNVYGSPEELSQLTPGKTNTNINWSNSFPGITGLGGNTFLSKGISQLGSGLTNIGKGTLDMFGNMKKNNREEYRNAKQFQQSVYSDAENRPQGQIYGKDIRGGNALFANGGMNIKEIGGQGEPNVEIEGKEHVLLPDGMSQTVQGDSHAEGGIPLNLAPGSMIFSEKLKDPTTGKSYAKLAKPFETKKDVNRQIDKRADDLQKKTADLNIKFKENKLKALFEQQEQDKLQGSHGKKVQMEAIQSLQQEQQMQPGQEQTQMPMGKNGMKLPEYGGGGKKVRKWNKKKDIDFTKVYNGNEQNPVTINNTNPVINTPQLPVGGGENGFYSGNLTEIPIKNRSYSTPESQEALSSFNVAPNYGYTNKPEDLQAAKSRYISLMRDAKVLTPELANKIQEAKNFQELNPLAGALQNYDYAAHPQISEHYGKNVPATRKGIQYLLDKKLINAKDFPGLIDKKGAIIGSMKDFKDKKYADKLQTIVQGAEPEIQNSYARANFVDNEAYYRAPEIKDIKFKTQAEKQAYLEGNKSNIYGDAVYSGTEGLYLRPTAPNEDPMVKQPTSDPVAPTDYKFTNKAKQQDFDMPNINMGIPLPYNEKTTPLNYYKIQPEFIDPRYLNVQPQLNDITRGVRTVQNNLGDRSTSSVGNSLQAQINAYGQENQVYGNKYNYDKGQDSQAQQFNAQAKMTTDQYNQNSWYNQLEDPIRARSSAKNKQFKENQQRGLENWNEQIAYNNNADYINKTFYTPQDLNSLNWHGQTLNPIDAKRALKAKWDEEYDKKEYFKQRDLGQAKNGGKVKIKPKIKLK
jgi:hypothetical protein